MKNFVEKYDFFKINCVVCYFGWILEILFVAWKVWLIMHYPTSLIRNRFSWSRLSLLWYPLYLDMPFLHEVTTCKILHCFKLFFRTQSFNFFLELSSFHLFLFFHFTIQLKNVSHFTWFMHKNTDGGLDHLFIAVLIRLRVTKIQSWISLLYFFLWTCFFSRVLYFTNLFFRRLLYKAVIM